MYLSELLAYPIWAYVALGFLKSLVYAWKNS